MENEKKFNCDLCEDEGGFSTDEMDSEGNIESGVGWEKCECRMDL